MNSHLEQNSLKKNEIFSSILDQFEKNLNQLNQANDLEILFKKLKFLGSQFDPFDSNISDEVKEILSTLNLDSSIHDPFLLTNLILKMLDLVEQKLQ